MFLLYIMNLHRNKGISLFFFSCLIYLRETFSQDEVTLLELSWNLRNVFLEGQ